MVACGCDVYLPGVPNYLPKKLHSVIRDLKDAMPKADRSNEDKFYNVFFAWVVNKSKLSRDVIDTFVKALLYQPTNYRACNTESKNFSQEPTYLEGPPKDLPSYLYQFKHPTTKLRRRGPKVGTCVGVEGAQVSDRYRTRTMLPL